jgi:acyl transferase domain-containing protein/thioesterase domain-containing protein/acyl carrier protein
MAQPVGGQPVGGQPVGGQPVGGQPVGGQPVGGQPLDGQPLGPALVGWVAQRCRLEPSEVDPDRPLLEYGLSSVEAVELAGLLAERLGRPVPAVLLWQYPTLTALAAFAAAVEPAPAGVAPAATGGPIAVVGLGCRFPGGADGPEAFWRQVLSGRDAVRTVPAGRWPDPPTEPAAAAVLAGPGRYGGFLDDVACFDAEFFGIPAGEAELMDPQQRLLLEVTWEALQHGELDPARLRGSRTGVYVGICSGEYAHLTAAELDRVAGWTATGGALSIAANRLSYLLNLRGPSLAVDTACSSSLVAVHLAARDLRAGDTDLAVAAGVNLMLTPALTLAFGHAGGLAAGGRCRPFDAGADGIVRGEGCGVVLLKRLADAERDGDRVLAVLRGSAVNADGRSNGLVSPNPQAQEALLRQACADAGIEPSTVDYVEAHGTGTPLGDPIEAAALGAVLGRGRAAGDELLVGSVKSQVGHLEAAAGVAGLISAVQALRSGTVPPTLHFRAGNPHIRFADWGLRVASAAQPFPARGRPARVGVSGFGFGGTNAHLVLEAYHGAATGPAATRPAAVVLADRDLPRVRAQAAALHRWLSTVDADVAAVAAALARRGQRGAVRAAVLASDPAGLADALAAMAAGRPHPAVATGSGERGAECAAWVFAGYGPQWAGMGRDLLAREPAFAAAVDELEPEFAGAVGMSLRAGLSADRTYPAAVTMPLLFGLQYGLAALWRSCGLQPGAVIGHSMGEVAAAVVAGALTPAEGVRVVAARARLLGGLGPGAMAVLELSESEYAAMAGADLHLAVVTSPTQLVVTGAPAAMDALVARVAGMGRLARVLTTEGAGHSPAVDRLLPLLRAELADLRPAPPLVPFYSTVRAGASVLDAGYWADNMRQPVRFADAVRAAAGDGYGLFVELSPHPTLVRPITQTLAALGLTDPAVVGSLRRSDPGAFDRGRAALHAAGRPVGPVGAATGLDLPPAPWRRQRHWFSPRPRPAPHAGLDTPALGELLSARWEQRPALVGLPDGGPVLVAAAEGDPLAAAILADPAAPAGTALRTLPPAGGPTGAAGTLPRTALGGAGTTGTRPVPSPVAAGAADAMARLAGDRPDAGVNGTPARLAGAGPAPAEGGAAAPVDRTAQLVIIAPVTGSEPDPAAAERLAAEVVAATRLGAGRLWVLTRGAAALGPDEAGAPDQGWVRGLVRTLAFEQPRARLSWVDLDPGAEPADQARALWAEVAGDTGDDEVAWRSRTRWTARLGPAAPAPPRPGPVVRPGAAYVLTGGYGGIGLRVARWLADGGAGRIVLAGRSGPGPAAGPAVAALRAAGPELVEARGDIAAAGTATELVAAARAGGMPLAGVVHAAGVRHDRLVADLAPADLSRVWTPKVAGAWRLHAAVAAAGVELDWWVSFSSAAGLLGSPGQAAYAGANAWLDAFAQWQRVRGVPAYSLQWGVWADIGGGTEARLPGIEPLDPGDGIAALAALLGRRPGTVGVLRFDPATALGAFPEAARLPFFAAVTDGAGLAAPADDDWPGPRRLRALPPTEATRAAGDRIAARISAVLGLDRPPPRTTPLTDLGLDSLAAVRVKNLIEADFDHELPTAVLVRGVTLADLETALTGALGIGTSPTARAESTSDRPRPTAAAGPTGPAVGARDAAERLAVRLFEAAVGRTGIGVTEEVDDRAAVIRIAAAANAEGATVTPAELLVHPTPQWLAGRLRAAEEAALAGAGLVRHLSGPVAPGPASPLFLGHPAGGSTHVYRQLGALLDPALPVYGLERLDTGGPVPERAARYADLIRATAPGPYRLGGWSFGGVLGYELACQLTAAGESVEQVVLIDSGLPEQYDPAEARRRLAARFEAFAGYLRETYELPIRVAAAELAELGEDDQFAIVRERMASAGLDRALPAPVLRHQLTSHEDTRALDDYRPGPYAGPVTLYRCTQPTPWAVRDARYEHADAARGWDRVCTDLRIVPVAGHHLNLLDPPAVTAIAADLRRLLPGGGGRRRDSPTP